MIAQQAPFDEPLKLPFANPPGQGELVRSSAASTGESSVLSMRGSPTRPVLPFSDTNCAVLSGPLT